MFVFFLSIYSTRRDDADLEIELFSLKLVSNQIMSAQSEECTRVCKELDNKIQQIEAEKGKLRKESRDLAQRLDYAIDNLRSLNTGQ